MRVDQLVSGMRDQIRDSKTTNEDSAIVKDKQVLDIKNRLNNEL